MQEGKLKKWRAKYGALIIALSCLDSAIVSWGNSWILTGVLGLGVFVCGIIGIFDLKRAIKETNGDSKSHLRSFFVI